MEQRIITSCKKMLSPKRLSSRDFMEIIEVKIEMSLPLVFELGIGNEKQHARLNRSIML